MGWISGAATVVVAVSLTYILLRKLQSQRISDIRGPDKFSSFLLGLSTSLSLAWATLTAWAA